MSSKLRPKVYMSRQTRAGVQEAVASVDAIAERTRLDRSSGVPLHVQIRDSLRALMGTDVLPWGAMAPPEGELARELSVSRMTLRQALSKLELEGLIDRTQGVGTVVRLPKFRHETQQLTSFSEDMARRGLTPSSRILKLGRVVPPAEVARLLRVDAAAQVWLCERLRLADEHPVGLHTSYLPADGLELSSMTDKSSLYEMLESAGKSVFRGDEAIEAVAANPYEADYLDVQVGSPLLLVSRTAYRKTGEPVEVVYARYRSDVYRYSLALRVGQPSPGGGPT